MKTLLMIITILVALISNEKAEELHQIEYQSGKYFNVVEDCEGNKIISLDEAAYLNEEDYTIIEWCPRIIEEDEQK